MQIRNITFRQAINEALLEEMERDKNVILIGEDIGVYGGAFGVTQGLVKRFGKNKVIDTPISENSFVGIAVGAAIMGLRPIVEIMFMDFITLCMDQILNHATKFHYIYNGQVKAPLVIRTPGGARGGYGATHSQNFESWFINIPGLKVVAPFDSYYAKGLLKSAIRDPNPVLFLENKVLYEQKGKIPNNSYILPLEKAVIRKKGKDITLISYSGMLMRCLEAEKILNKEGIDIEIIDLVSLKPIDIQTIIKSVRKTGKVIIVGEGCKTGGVGAEISALIMEHAFKFLKKEIQRIAIPDVPIPASTFLEKQIVPNASNIIDAIMKTLA